MVTILVLSMVLNCNSSIYQPSYFTIGYCTAFLRIAAPSREELQGMSNINNVIQSWIFAIHKGRRFFVFSLYRVTILI